MTTKSFQTTSDSQEISNGAYVLAPKLFCSVCKSFAVVLIDLYNETFPTSVQYRAFTNSG